jgi:hypothetical protein
MSVRFACDLCGENTATLEVEMDQVYQVVCQDCFDDRPEETEVGIVRDITRAW